MADLPTPDQVGSAAAWLTSKAGISTTILAFVSIALAAAYVWERRTCGKTVETVNAAWIKAIDELSRAKDAQIEGWAKRMDQFRADVKEAFNQNDAIADKVVDALHKLNIEVARVGARRDRD